MFFIKNSQGDKCKGLKMFKIVDLQAEDSQAISSVFSQVLAENVLVGLILQSNHTTA